MTSENLTKFKEIISKADTVIIKTSRTIDLTKVLAAELLSRALGILGKTTKFDISGAPENVRRGLFELLGENLPPAKNLEEKENILIKLDTKKLPIAQLKYEKIGDLLKIVLEGKAGALDTSLVSVEKEKVPADLLVLIDTQKQETETMLNETPHKDVVKISTGDSLLALKIIGIVKTLLDSVPRELNELVFFLLKTESRTLSAYHLEFHLELRGPLSEIYHSGVDEKKLIRARTEFYPSQFWKLLGRALARSHFEKESGIFWSVLSRNDFEKTGAEEGFALEALENLRTLKPECGFFALLFERAQNLGLNKKSISAIVAGSDAGKLNLLASSLGTEPASSYFFANDFESFSDAEIKIRSSIRKVML